MNFEVEFHGVEAWIGLLRGSEEAIQPFVFVWATYPSPIILFAGDKQHCIFNLFAAQLVILCPLSQGQRAKKIFVSGRDSKHGITEPKQQHKVLELLTPSHLPPATSHTLTWPFC